MMIGLYILASLYLIVHGLHCYWMVILAFVNKPTNNKRIIHSDNSKIRLPKITTQLPLFNEKYVLTRLLQSITDLDYPKNLHEIQVLDDSTDETSSMALELIKFYKAEGYNIKYLNRSQKIGFKAGALEYGLNHSEGELIAIFDADFMPDPDFFTRVIPCFLTNENIGFVQTKWGFFNSEATFLTKLQSIGIKGHFEVEQIARSSHNLIMNFNGTAGVLRKKAIVDSGGWAWDTLTEDLDLSYRMELNGWESIYLPDVEVKSELPAWINSFKAQQHRWAKGSTQTALKILPQMFVHKKSTWVKKIEAFFHLTHYSVHVMVVILLLLAIPLSTISLSFPVWYFGLVLVSAFGPTVLYTYALLNSRGETTLKSIFLLPCLMSLGVGLSLNNARGVLEAIWGSRSPFIRTPKVGKSSLVSMIHDPTYFVKGGIQIILEIYLGLYTFLGSLIYLSLSQRVVSCFLFVASCGFFYVALASLNENRLGSLKKEFLTSG